MPEKLRLFVSATRDLEGERAAIGKAIAELPIQLGVEIRRTPASGASYDDIFESVANVDRVYFLLGRDITAPSGAEWHLSWQLERSVMPLAAAVRRSLAAQEFMRNALIKWGSFQNIAHLTRLVTLDLVRILNHPTNRYGLSVTDLELLTLHARRTMQQAPAEERMDGGSAGPEPGGAEGGGILLDPAQNDEIDEEYLVEN